MFKTLFENVQQQTPLVHCITNYVTVNDVANALLAAGGSPIMADAPEEVADITSICTALNLNIGTLNSRAVESMLLAGRQANALAHPVVLDPVGAGASPFRTETTFNLLEDIAFTVIREHFGNENDPFRQRHDERRRCRHQRCRDRGDARGNGRFRQTLGRPQ